MHAWHVLIPLAAASCAQSEGVTFVSDWADRATRCENRLSWKPESRALLSELNSFGDLSLFDDPEFEPRSAGIVLEAENETVLFVSGQPNISPKPDLPAGPEPPDIDTPEFIAWHDSVQKCLSKGSRLYSLPSNKFLEIPVTAYCGNYWDSPDQIRFTVYDINGILFAELSWSSPAHAEFRLIRINAGQLVTVARSTC